MSGLLNEDGYEYQFIDWLKGIGWDWKLGHDIAHDGIAPEREDYKEVLLLERLSEALKRINPELPRDNIRSVAQLLASPGEADLLKANELIMGWLVNGIPQKVRDKDGNETSELVRVIDFENLENNDFLAVNQFTVAHNSDAGSRRPDIVLFVNGLPLAVIELKNPLELTTDIWEAFNQLQTYKKHITRLFFYNVALAIADGADARAGSLTADRERFLKWRSVDGEKLDPHGAFGHAQSLIEGLFDRRNLLDVIQYFSIFIEAKQTFKMFPGYHQFYAVNKAYKRALSASQEGGDGKGGLMWHTQGSGKSYEMACLAGKLVKSSQLKNPTIVLVTDRNNLDDQLYDTFVAAKALLRQDPVMADSRDDLRTQIGTRPAGGVVFTTIQKFKIGDDEEKFPALTDRRNVFVFTDEAHRSQYGFSAKIEKNRFKVGYAQHLRDALPNATFVAFTGTPISTTDRDTQAVFGEHIHVYDMQQAQQDGATVAIYYESRLAKLGLDEAELTALDEDIDELAEDEEESAQAKLKQRWSALEKVVGAAPRIAQVAEDLVQHFEERSEVQYGKAMIAAMSREICVHLYNEIVKLRPQWHDDDPEKGEIKIVMTGSASDKALLRPHIYPSLVKKRLEKRFKDPGDPLKLVIVRDMWLTGFDAPCVHTLYVDKPIKGLNLIQAISRVNRVFKDKQGGLVVDYIGIGEDLKAAMKTYAANKGKGRPTVDSREALAIVLERMDILRAMLHGFDYTNFRTGGHRILAGAANHVLGLPSINDEDPKRRFADHALALSHAFSLCCTLAEARELRDEIAFMQAVKVILTKPAASGKRLTDEEKDYAVRQIINSAVVSIGVVDIFESVGLEKPNIGLLDEAFLTQVRNLPEKNLAVELLERLLQGEIKSRFKTNIIQDRKFSEMLSEVIRRYQNRSIETAQVIEELIELAKKFREASNRGESLGLSADEEKFYDALAANESAVRELKDEILKKIAQELTEGLRKNLTVDWAIRESVRAKLRIMIRRILKKYRYPPDQQESAVDLVLQQAETVGEEMMPKT